MNRINSQARNAGLAVCTAMAAVLLAGCAGQGQSVASASSTPVAQSAGDLAASDSVAITQAERRVAKAPNDAGSRLALAQAYLAAGRFEAASTTFEDVEMLGYANPSAALAQSLAYIGAGRQADAQALLERYRDKIPASDYGLAIALAGQPSMGVAILTDVVRGGDSSAKARQNLAYAYALDGRWGPARVIAGQDLPAGQVDARLAEWAQKAMPQDYRKRVAALLDAPVRSDPGQPVALALAGRAPVQYAEAAPVAPAVALAPAGELPALGQPAPMPLARADDVPQQPVRDSFALAPAPAPAAIPIVQPVAATRAPRSVETAFADLRPDAVAGPAPRKLAVASEQPGGNHRVQLGSFRTLDGAKRSFAIFKSRNPELRDHQLEITEAMVGGRRYFRVAARDFGQVEATSFCSSVKGRGHGCFAYAETRKLPGAIGGSPVAPGRDVARTGAMRAR